MKKRLIDAVLLFVGLCLTIRLAVWIIEPVLIPAIAVTVVGTVALVFFHQRWA